LGTFDSKASRCADAAMAAARNSHLLAGIAALSRGNDAR